MREDVFKAVEEVSGVEVTPETKMIDSLPNLNSIGLVTVLTKVCGDLSRVPLMDLSESDMETVGKFADWIEKNVS